MRITMLWITLLFSFLVVVSSWLYTASITKTKFPRLRNKRICLLIAHPDDEAMFFAPTLLALTQPELGNHVKILCLSSGKELSRPCFLRQCADYDCKGDADGLGETRKKELMKSGMLLGLRKEEDVFIVESPYA
jgi:N-acetylglucosaminylphosphatidylinositol deacetylase